MEHSYFWPDLNGDREYGDDDFAELFGGFVTHGVYDGDLAVTPGGGMAVTIPEGRAFVGPAWKVRKYYNDGPLTLPISNADGVLNRRDIIVLRSDVNDRSITAKVIQGEFASNPVAPQITRDAEQYDIELAEISIPAGTTEITGALITDKRLDSSVCGIVTGVVQQVDTTTFYNQIAADLAAFKGTEQADFVTWFDSVKGQLGTDAAGNLFNLINEHKADTNNPHQTTAEQVGALPDTTTTLPNPAALTISQGYGGQTGTYDGSATKSISIPHITLHTSAPGTVADGELWGVY